MLNPEHTDNAIGRIRRAVVQACARFGANLAAGMRLALPLPAPRARFAATLGQLLALLAALAALSLADDLVAVGLPAEFAVWGLLSWSTISYFWLATLAVIAVVSRRESAYLRVAVGMAAVLVFQFAVWSLTKNLSDQYDVALFNDHYTLAWSAFLGWEAIVFARVLTGAGGMRQRQVLPLTALYAGATYAVLTLLPHSPLFVAPWEPEAVARIDVESTYYAQSNLLGQALFELSPQRPGAVDLYFVGFAAYGYQDVFQREIEQATLIFERQFDAIGHTVALINNPKTLQTRPLANRHNLDRVVRDLAERIDRDEDIVVLFLSSHGDDDATISVALDGFALNDLSAGDVREIFDTHGIQWRIVIVSACYSGSFIESLATPRTLIVTAAASDRASFGCAHENAWTYFGEAYFGHALARSHSFVEAFELAARRIAQREAEEDKEASRPQISLGEEIAAYLQQHAL